MSKSPSLRRIQADIRELSLDPSSSFHAAPLENDMFEWYVPYYGSLLCDWFVLYLGCISLNCQ
jgi:ubiquitin-conjugating enzyme E2 J1